MHGKDRIYAVNEKTHFGPPAGQRPSAENTQYTRGQRWLAILAQRVVHKICAGVPGLRIPDGRGCQ